MSEFALTDPYLFVNGVDAGDWLSNVQITINQQVVSSPSRNGTVQREGIRSDAVSLVFNQDHAASATDATIWALVGAGPVAFLYRPTQAARSATNPEYSGNIVLDTYQPVANEVGSFVTAAVEVPVDGELSRVTAP